MAAAIFLTGLKGHICYTILLVLFNNQYEKRHQYDLKELRYFT